MATTAARVVFKLVRDDEPAARCTGQLARRIMGMGFVQMVQPGHLLDVPSHPHLLIS